MRRSPSGSIAAAIVGPSGGHRLPEAQTRLAVWNDRRMGALDVVDRAEDLGFSSQRLARIRPFFEDHYVRKGLLPGLITLVARRGRVASVECFGSRDVATGAPVELDTIFRLYSMTKPIVSVALMTLYEQ